MNIQQRIQAELDALESASNLRHLDAVTHRVNLGSNDYLGLSTDPRMKEAVREASDFSLRVASTGSRLLSGHDPAWTELETEFARWIGTEAALYFTSGYAANVGLLTAILRPDDLVFSDSANHASLIDGMRLAKCGRIIYPHLDMNALETELRRAAYLPGARFIVFESVFSMDGACAPMDDLFSLALRYDAELIVDEAHATGACGPAGRGLVTKSDAAKPVFATVHTCGKALAAAGALICGSDALRQLLINRARSFIYSTALPPYFAGQVRAGLRLAAASESKREHLAKMSAFLRGALRAQGFDTANSNSHIIPVILGSNEATVEFASRLQGRGYGIRAIRPPTVPVGAARLRLSMTAEFSYAQVSELVETLVEVRNEIAPLAISIPR